MGFCLTLSVDVSGFQQKEGTYKGKKFNAICHFFGYQARGSLPSKFDCDYAYVCCLGSLYLSLCYSSMLHVNKINSLAGSRAHLLPHPCSWFEWLHGNCN